MPLEREYGFKVLPEARTQIIARGAIPGAGCASLPGAVAQGERCRCCGAGRIEILSPDDRISETLERFRDYSGIGVSALSLLDPERYVAYRFESGSLIEAPLQQLGMVPFSSEAIFTHLRTELAD